MGDIKPKNTIEESKLFLKQYVETITQPSKQAGKNHYICPFCHSGTGKKKTGGFSLYDNNTQWKCFSCGKNGDIYDLIGEVENIPTFQERKNRLEQLFNVIIEGNPSNEAIQPIKRKTEDAESTENETDFTAFFLQAKKDLHKTAYPETRGLSAETCERFGLGFCQNWTHPKAPKATPTPRLIIPTSPHSYLARDTREESEIPPKEKAFSKAKVGKTSLFNLKACLYEATQPIFIVEGEIDAMSIYEVGGEAIGLGSATNAPKLISAFKNAISSGEWTDQPFILALDYDEAGEKAYNTLKEELKKLNIPYSDGRAILQKPNGGFYKDPNEALIANKEEFKRLVASLVDSVKNGLNTEEAIDKAELEKACVTNNLEAFFLQALNHENKHFATGFLALDEILHKGIRKGLYILGGTPGAGKTTFALQIADNLAKSGVPVLVFSLEMERNELIARSLSRILYGQGIKKSQVEIEEAYQFFSTEEKQALQEAIQAYSYYSGNLFIFEGVGNMGTAEIRDIYEKFYRYYKWKPVVIVDYLQMLSPADIRATDKQNTDWNVLALKRLSRDYLCPVICISSLNRENYGNVSMKAFKESGSIDYGADCMLMLKAEEEQNQETKEWTTRTDDKGNRFVHVHILKHRKGETNTSFLVTYNPKCNIFIE